MPNSMSNKARYLIILINVSLIGLCIIFNISLLYGFCFAISATIVILMRNGFQFKYLFFMIIKGISESSRIVFIILLIGALISIWMASGTVPAMIYYGLDLVMGRNYLFMSYLISLVTAIIMGTPLGTVSTIGIALLAIGKGLSIPIPILLGAIISGAFVGDKISPVSGLMNLTVKACGTDYNRSLKEMLKTLIPIVALSGIIYYLMGLGYKSDITPSTMNMFQSSIQSSFYLNPILLLLPVGIIVLSICGLDILYNMGIGIISGIIISVFLQGIELVEVIKIVFHGFKATTERIELNAILTGGGILSMIELVLIIGGAIVLSSLLDGTNTINPIIDSMLKSVGTKGKLVKKTTFLSAILTLITTDQTVGIIVLGKSMQRKYEELGIDRSILARAIIDTGVSIPPLIPWNITSIIITAITGVAVWDYGIYTVMCYVSPIITIIIGYLDTKKSKYIKAYIAKEEKTWI